MKHLGIYYRVSTGKQDFASQKTGIRDYLASLPKSKQPLTITEFKDHGESGMNSARTDYKALIKAGYEKRIDTILVYRLDRLSRNATEAIQLILNLDAVGVGFLSATQPVLNMGLDNPFRRTMLAAFCEIAELERDTIVSRVKAGIESAQNRGAKLGRPSEQTDAKREEALSMSEKGASLSAIAKELGMSKTSVQRLITKET